MGKKSRSKNASDAAKVPEFRANPFAVLSAADLGVTADSTADDSRPDDAAVAVPEETPRLSAADRELLTEFGDAALAVGGDRDGVPRPAPGVPCRGRVRLQIQRKGKGGKTVTRVLGLEAWDLVEQTDLMREACAALGTGAHFDEGVLELHGDQRDRAAAWFRRVHFVVL